jgi:monoamine oxidase
VRVIVIGAGLAGLAAADELQRAGVEVEVFEARDRVGGRIWSVPFAGAVAECGAEFILPEETELTATAGRMGLTLVRKGTLYGDREQRGAEEVSSAEMIAALEPIAASAPGAGHGTASAALAGSGLRPPVAEAIRARVEVSCAHSAEDLDASVLWSAAAAFGDFDSYTLGGGNGSLTDALARGLGDALHLGAAVTRVSRAGSQVRILAGELAAAADAVIIAVPPTVIGSIAFDSPLPGAKLAALRSLRLGQAAKLFIGLRSPAPPSATISVPERFWCYTQLGADGQPLPFVGAFAGTRKAIDALGVANGPERWVAAVAALRPDLDLDLETVLLCRWDNDPWVRGAYSARSPGSPLGSDQMSAPVGPLHFAGEHTAGEYHGLMEGALRSGRRAAREVLGKRVTGRQPSPDERRDHPNSGRSAAYRSR